MSLFKAKEKSAGYRLTDLHFEIASDAQLEKWAMDPDCINKNDCATYLANRHAQRASVQAKKREELQDNPFDPRTEVSADAKHIGSRIVTHLWIIFVLLPFVLGVLWALMK